jgi:hypothetical protein
VEERAEGQTVAGAPAVDSARALMRVNDRLNDMGTECVKGCATVCAGNYGCYQTCVQMCSTTFPLREVFVRVA